MHTAHTMRRDEKMQLGIPTSDVQEQTKNGSGPSMSYPVWLSFSVFVNADDFRSSMPNSATPWPISSVDLTLPELLLAR